MEDWDHPSEASAGVSEPRDQIAAEPEMISFGTCKCGVAGQLFEGGMCARCQPTHTPEPWSLREQGSDGLSFAYWIESSDRQICGLWRHHDRKNKLAEAGIDEANARRIVACVNACAGTSTEWLESNRPIVLLGPPIAERYQALERQRDALFGEGYILAMRLLQSDLVLDDEERAAMDAFLPKSLKG